MKKHIIIAALLILAACGPVYRTYHDYKAPRSADGRICASQCLTTKQYCADNCRLRAGSCNSDSNIRAEQDYHHYIREQNRQGKPVTRSRSSFSYSAGCSSSQCEADCGENYNACYSTCGGEVNTRVVCTSGCEKAGGYPVPNQSPVPEREPLIPLFN